MSGEVFAFPVTFAQQRFWFLDRLSPDNSSYGIGWALRLTGPLDAAVLERSLDEIVRRHEILRTTFSVEDGEPVQLVGEAPPFVLPLIDVAHEKEARRFAAEEARRPFNLEQGPLLRGRLLRLGPDDHVLALSTHHIVFDGSSRRVLIRELAELYGAFLEGKPSPLPDLPLQYADFAVWQRKQVQGKVLEAQIAWWKNQLAGAPATLALPTDRPRPATQSFAGAVCGFTCSKELTARVREFARRRETTPYIVLLAAFQALLSRYSGEDDIVVGTPIAGRNRVEIENLIGLFANTLVLRADTSGAPTAADFVARVKEMALAAYAHQDAPFEKLVEELQPERSLSYNPIFQVLFAFLGGEGRQFELPGLKVEPLGGGLDASKFDLSLLFTEMPESLSGRLEYSTDLFDAATAERMMAHYQALLAAMLANPGARLAELPVLTATERERTLIEWNATGREYPRDLCLHRLFERQAERTPDRIAVTAGGRELTYAALNARANQVAHYLLRRGAGPDVTIGIRMTRGVDMLAGLLGILKAGSAYVPLDPAFPEERLAYILEDSAVLLTLTDKDWARFDGEAVSNPVSSVTPENMAYVLHTSGSTGKPKGVQITHRNVVNFLVSMQSEPGMTAEDTLLAVTTLSFDIAGLELYLPLVSGARIVIASRDEAVDPGRLLGLMKQWRPTVMQATPVTWRMLIEAGWSGSSRLKVLCGGEAMPADLGAQLLPLCAELWNMYGPTETTIWSSVYKLESAPAGAVPLGRPIANTTMYVLDARMQPVPVGVSGELYIGGDGVARGYLNRPDLTAERFLADPFVPGARIYRTGDVAKFLPDGVIQYLGRADFQVKVRGFRIELGEVETVLAQHSTVHECVVLAREERLVAYVIPAQDCKMESAALRAWVKEHLPDYMAPAAFMQLDRFPLTANGKVDRKALPDPDYSQSGTAGGYVEPRTPVEKQLAAIWAEMLKLERVGVTDNFFELGGHSLLAVQVFARMEKITGKKLTLDVLFRSPTIEQIAAVLSENDRGPRETSIRPCRTEGSKPPLYAAHGIGGTVLTFRNIVANLQPDQPVYALEAFGNDRSWTCLEDLAALYVKDILAFQPAGPYHLIGSSFGGMVVFEMARQLHAQGHEVGLVGMLDSGNMGRRNVWTRKERLNEKARFFNNRTLMHLRRFKDRKPREWPRYAAGRLLAVGRLMHSSAWRLVYRFYKAPNKLPAPLLNMKRVYESAGLSYIPKKYAGAITLFFASELPRQKARDTQLGWAGWTEKGVEVIDVPGDHNSMVQEPHVKVLAAELTKCLARYTKSSAPMQSSARG